MRMYSTARVFRAIQGVGLSRRFHGAKHPIDAAINAALANRVIARAGMREDPVRSSMRAILQSMIAAKYLLLGGALRDAYD